VVVASSVRRAPCPQALGGDAVTGPAGGKGAALSRPALGRDPSLGAGAVAAPMPTGPEPPTSATERSELLEAVMREEGALLRRQAFRHSQSAEAAEEALQDAAVQFLRRFEGETANHALRWMLTTVKRCAWAITRRERRRPLVLSTTDVEDRDAEAFIAREEGDGPAELAERRAEHGETVRAFETLKPDERTALLMLGLGCSYEEIGARRGWTRTKVNRCLSEGREALRAAERGGGDGR